MITFAQSHVFFKDHVHTFCFLNELYLECSKSDSVTHIKTYSVMLIKE